MGAASVEATEAPWVVAVVEGYHTCCRKRSPEEPMHHILGNKA